MSEPSLKEKTKSAFHWSFLNNLSHQVIALIFGVILARLLGPRITGLMAMPAVFFALSSVFINSGFSRALIRKPDLREEDLSTAFIFNTIVGFVCSCILFFLSSYIADFFKEPILVNVVRVSSITVFLGTFQSVHYIQFDRNLDFKTPAKINIICNISTGVVGIILAYLGFGIWALVFQGVAGLFLTMVLVWHISKWRPRTGWSWDSFRYLWGYGSNMLLSDILDNIRGHVNPVVIGRFYDATALGLYNKAFGYAILPHQQISGMLLDGVAFSVFGKLQNDKEKLNEFFLRLLKMAVFITCPILFGLSATSEPLIYVMLTEKWKDCIPIMALMCFPVLFWPIQSINFGFIQALGRTDYVLKMNAFVNVTGFIIIILTVLFFLKEGIIAIVWGGILHILIVIPIVTHLCGRFSGLGFVKQMKAIFPILMTGVVMYVSVKISMSYFDNMYYKLLIGIPTGVIVYSSIVFLFRFKQIDDIRYMIQLKSKGA